MAETSPTTPSIPRYLRYKAEEKRANDYWDEQLDLANRVIQDRVSRMHRDNLCAGCA
jgi:hypothetical protein